MPYVLRVDEPGSGQVDAVLGSYDEPSIAVAALDLARSRFAAVLVGEPDRAAATQRLVIVDSDGLVMVRAATGRRPRRPHRRSPN
jgi:hypothetical protein